MFFCAFLALRSEDNKTPVERIRDFEIHREEELFAGSVSVGPCVSDPRLTQRRRIVDDHYEHALRMFQEKDTGVIRLQASVQTGECKRQVDHQNLFAPITAVLIRSPTRKPIWTAFITHQILSPTWMSRDSSRVVRLAELQRYVFTDEYNPQMTPEGAHELTFIESNGT